MAPPTSFPRFSPTFILLSLLLMFTTNPFTVSANDDVPTFPLRVWTHPRSTLIPAFNHNIELDESSGDAIINKTASHPGFESYIEKEPGGEKERGRLRKVGTKEWGYLFPEFGEDGKRRHQLQYGRGIPTIAGVYFTNFTREGRMCGGNCGGMALAYYDFAFYVAREKPESGIWKVKAVQTGVPVEKDWVPVYIWTF